VPSRRSPPAKLASGLDVALACTPRGSHTVGQWKAKDWYRQRADHCPDDELRGVLILNMRDETEDAAMLAEWLRGNDEHFAG
jgi:hypothetical protein